MKYIVICTVALIICLIIGYLIARLITRKKPKSFRLKRVLLTLCFGIVLMVIVSIIYLSIHYSATNKALEALNGNETVTVTKVVGGYFFDGPGEDTAMIFYAGAKVEPESYAPLLLQISEKGIDCFLADMPLNFPLLGANKADNFINTYTYKNWYLTGHSMGGIVATNYVNSHTDKINGIILLASYPSKQVDSSLSLLSIYGREDGVLDKETYEEAKQNWTTNSVEYIIEGGNHSQFGNYGEQDGDNKALITSEQQQSEVTDIISAFCN